MCWVFLKVRIDDPLSAAPMHGVCVCFMCLIMYRF